MEFKIKKSAFLKALSKVLYIAEKRTTLPILSNILLVTNKSTNSLIIKATNLEIGLTQEYACDILKDGSAVISAKELYDIIRELPETDVVVKRIEESRVHISTGNIVFKLVTLDEKEYPSIPVFNTKKSIPMDAGLLLQMIDRTIFAASLEESRYNLNGCYLERGLNKEDDVIKMVATDGHRLSLTTNHVPNFDKANVDKGVIIPRRGLIEIRKLLEEEGENPEISFDKNHIIIKRNNQLLMVRLIEGVFPDYTQVIPKTLGNKIVVKRESLLNAVRRVSLLSMIGSDKIRCVKLELGENKMVLSSNNPEVGEAREEVDVDNPEKNKTSVTFNAKYFTDVLSCINTDDVVLGVSDDISPVVVTFDGVEQFINVIMPVRL